MSEQLRALRRIGDVCPFGCIAGESILRLDRGGRAAEALLPDRKAVLIRSSYPIIRLPFGFAVPTPSVRIVVWKRLNCCSGVSRP
jgi:hypothetical protein